ncbi:NACHT domain-containing protein [Lentzea sp. NPDC059081]|uniref:NACHT domain-containing protein n=1 Tax=Lentzea sp. NPDC059081 TaxID=3346719 RepID=UPI0036B7F107
MLDADDHLVITGGPGQGKSTLALRLAADLALSWSGDGAAPLTEDVVPLRLPARELAARLNMPFAEALAASARAEYNVRLKCAIDPSHFEERVDGRRWLLLVDGLDEVTSSTDRDDLVHALAGWASSGDVYRIVLTTRPIEGGVLTPLQRIGAVRYELQPFDEEALRLFAVSWFEEDNDSATSFLRQIRKAYLDELVRVPLLATIAAIVFEQRRAHPLPDNQYELYEAYLKYLRTGHPHRPSALDPHREALLEHLGLVRVDADTSLLGAARAWAAENAKGEWQDDLARFLTAVGPFMLRADDVQFLHHSFADHLAATGRARGLPDRFSAEHTDFAHLLHAARPREHGRHARRVLLHYGRLHPPQADALLDALNGGDSEQHLLAARLLAGHLPARPEAVSNFLATARGWAMTTHFNAYEILAGASRATHHPGLSDWLVGLMNDERAPWSSRVEAAAALATRLRDHHEQSALACLHTTVSNPDTQAGHRLIAAEALSELGESQRNMAEHALRAILADPFATSRDHRDAALVMASLGGAARLHAVDELVAALNHSEASQTSLVEAARGLVEIAAEHSGICAEVLAEVLRTRSASGGTSTLNLAAEALSAMGPREVALGVRALTERITSVHLARWDRVVAAATMARLGPPQRDLAARHLLMMADEPGVPRHNLWQCGEMLSKCGWEHREHAVSVLRRALHDVSADANMLLWAAMAFGELGPRHQAEAVGHLKHLIEATDHRHAVHWERETALRALATTDKSERPGAVAALRAVLADEVIDPGRRNQAALELVELGPEFHAEVVGPLRGLTVQRYAPELKVSALRCLVALDSRVRPELATTLISLMAVPGESEDAAPIAQWFTKSTFDDVPAAAEVLLHVLDDQGRDEGWRGSAACNLVTLGQQFHRDAVRGLVDLIRAEAIPRCYLRQWLKQFTDVAAVFQRQIADALWAMTTCSDSTTGKVVNFAEAMETTGRPHEPEFVAVLWPIVVDAKADPEHRVRAALLVASAQPELAGQVAEAVVGDHRDRSSDWDDELCVLTLLGADPAPQLIELVEDADTPVGHRVRAVSALVQLRRCGTSDFLRRFADDEYLCHEVRVHALKALAEHSRSAVTEVLDFHQRVQNDLTETAVNRCESARHTHKLDVTATSAVVDQLRDVAAHPDLTAAEKVRALRPLDDMTHETTVATNFLAGAIARDPACRAADRKTALHYQMRRERLAGQRMLLSDRWIPLEDRVPHWDYWSYQPLPREIEAAVRDVLAAPESTVRDRVTAAVELARLSTRFVGEAVEVLNGLGWRGQEELAKFGPRWSSQVQTNAHAVVADRTKPWRDRWLASRLLWPAEPGVEPRSDEQRMELAEACKEINVLRAMLTSDRPATRWRAAKRLREYDFADRIAAAQVLEAIGRDPSTSPALRWRAAEELARFGAKGRERGVPVLRDLIVDESLPALARVEAAGVVGRIRPDLRSEIVRFLRAMNVGEPMWRIRLQQTLGEFESEEGARALHGMTTDQSPVVRIRAAEAMLQLRRDYRERAAITARSVMHDETAPRHVRRRAACDLARWSDLCLEEARAFLREL